MVVNNDLIANFHGLLWKHVLWVEWKFQVFVHHGDWNPLESTSIRDFMNPVRSMPARKTVEISPSNLSR